MSFETIGDAFARSVGIHRNTEELEAATKAFRQRMFSVEGFDEHVIDAQIEDSTARIASAWRRCESPIEARLMPHLVLQGYGPEHDDIAILGDRIDWQADIRKVQIVPNLAVKGARFDFLVVARRRLQGIPVHLAVAVECDGKQYHMPADDWERDVAFAQIGVTTLRLTGSEIHANAAKAAGDVAFFVRHWGDFDAMRSAA